MTSEKVTGKKPDDELALKLGGDGPPGKAITTDTAETGPEPFREWLNKRIAARGATVTIGEEHCLVTELTPDFQLRVKFGEGHSLIAFAGDTISTVIEQVQPRG
jgi:hypothetical protein